MLQIEVICFGLAIEVQRLQDLTQQLKQDIDQANQHNKTYLNTIDQNNLAIQHHTRKIDLLQRSKIQIEQDYNQLKSQYDYVIDIISQITGNELTLEELNELIEELKKRSLKYDRIQELLNGQNLSEIISKSEQYDMQYTINQELRDQLEQYPQIVISLNQDLQQQKLQIQNQKFSINQLTELNTQLQEQILKSKHIQDQRQNSDLQSSDLKFISPQTVQQEQNQKQLIELKNRLNSVEHQNISLKEEISSILNLKMQIEAKLRNLILDQNKLLNEKEKLAKETFYLVSISNNFKTELQNKQNEIGELTNQNSLLQNQVKNQENQIENLLKQNQDSESKLKIEINNLNQEIQSKSFQIDELRLEIQFLNDESKKLNEELKNQMRINKHSKQFSQQIEIIQDKLLLNKNFIQMQDNQLQILQQQSIKDKNELENHYKGIIEQLNQENYRLKFELDQFQNTIHQLEDQLIQFQTESQENKDLLDSKNLENDKLIAFNKKIQESNEKHISKNQELEQQIRKLEFKQSSIQTFNQGNSLSSDNFKQIIDKIKSENQQYQSDIHKLDLLNQELVEQISSMKFEINNYQIQITNLTMQVENAQSQFQEDYLQEINQNRQQHLLSINQINDLKEKTQKQQQQILEQNNQILRFQKDIQMHEKKFIDKEKQIIEQELFIRQLQQEFNLLNNYLIKIQDQFQTLQQEQYKKIQENIDLTNQIVKLKAGQQQTELKDSQFLEEIQVKNNHLLFENQQLNQQIYEKSTLLEQKCLLIDKFNLKIMNQNGEIFQLRKQVTQQENQIKQFQNEIEKTKQGCEIDQVENKKLYEMTQINLKLSQVIDEKEQKIHLLKHDLEVSQIKVDEIEKVNNNLLNKLNERYQIFQSQSEQFSKSLISSETLFSQNVENDYYQQQLQILQNKYDDILKENQILLNNSSQIEEYKNKVALLSLEVSRYHNLQKGSPSQNFIQSPRVENQVMINKISLNQEKESRIKTEHVFDNNYKDSDFYCLLVLLFAEIESLRTKLDEKKIEDRSQVQQIIEFYRPKAQ